MGSETAVDAAHVSKNGWAARNFKVRWEHRRVASFWSPRQPVSFSPTTIISLFPLLRSSTYPFCLHPSPSPSHPAFNIHARSQLPSRLYGSQQHGLTLNMGESSLLRVSSFRRLCTLLDLAASFPPRLQLHAVVSPHYGHGLRQHSKGFGESASQPGCV